MPVDWRTAYFAQAKADFEIFNLLKNRDGIPLCQKLHYLQMSTEKFAKGFLTPPGGGPYGYTHNAFKQFVQVAQLHPDIREIFGSSQAKPFREYVKSMLETAGYIENLSPEGGDHPNPEYPWMDKKGDIVSPLDYPFSNLDMEANPKMIRMVRFIEGCFRLPYI